MFTLIFDKEYSITVITGLKIPTTQNALLPERKIKTAHNTKVKTIKFVFGYTKLLIDLGKIKIESDKT